MQLYRSVREDADGLPTLGPSARMLGVRSGSHPAPYVLAVHATDMVLPDQGGISVAPDDAMNLLRHRRPASLGGTGREPVWYIETDDLGPDLNFRLDRPTHGLIEPKRPMALQDFQDALAGTRPNWKRPAAKSVCKNRDLRVF